MTANPMCGYWTERLAMSSKKGKRGKKRRKKIRGSPGGSGRAARAAARGRTASRPIAPNRKIGVFVAVFLLAALGWGVGRYGLVVWIPMGFLAAAVVGFWYPALLGRVLDQHSNLAREVGDESWKGSDKVPLADVAVAVLLLLGLCFWGSASDGIHSPKSSVPASADLSPLWE